MFSLNSANSVTKKLKSKRKLAGLEPRTSCVREQILTLNSCLSDFSHSLNSLNSVNLMKLLLYLEKTPVGMYESITVCCKIMTRHDVYFTA